MHNTAETDFNTPVHPLSEHQLSRLKQAVNDLNTEQLTWSSGYLAGLGAKPLPAARTETVPVMTILFATQGGNARSVAEALASAATDRGFETRIVAADDYRPRDLVREKLLIAVISTQGEGDPPESAHEIFRFLNGKKPPRLEQLKYCVLGLGDSSYDLFCKAGRDLDHRLQQLGAVPLVDRIDADVDFQALTQGWYEQILKNADNLLPSGQARVIPLLRDIPGTRRHDRNHPYRSEVLDVRTITTPDALSAVHHLVLGIDIDSLVYQPGDSLGVHFHNDPSLVREILDLAGLTGEEPVDLSGETATLAESLGRRLELTQLHPSVVTRWAEHTENAELQTLASDLNKLRSFAGTRQFIDLLRAYPGHIGATELVKLLQPLQPRLYSIASSQSAFEDEIHLTVSTLQFQAHGRNHLGGASGYLTKRIEAGDAVDIYIVENRGFRLPQDQDAPIIMVGAGTGIAPFRAFLQERELQTGGGRNWLMFGNRHFHRDFLYQTDWLRYRKTGLLNRASVAFSRDGEPGTYVQNRLMEEGAEVYRWLQDGAHLYVCGGIEMEKAVQQTILKIARDQGGLNQETAVEYIEDLRTQGRYQRDVY